MCCLETRKMDKPHVETVPVIAPVCGKVNSMLTMAKKKLVKGMTKRSEQPSLRRTTTKIM